MAALKFDDIAEMENGTSGAAKVTPLIHSPLLDRITGCELRLKAENLQETGSFKFRGAYNAILREVEAGRTRIITASSGNFGIGAAAAARELGAQLIVVAPCDAPRHKLESVRDHGAEVVPYDRWTEDRMTIAASLAERSGGAVLNHVESAAAIAGYAAVGEELLAEFPSVDLIIVPAGGGGLLAAIAGLVQSRGWNCRVIGAQHSEAPALHHSVLAGSRVAVPPAPSLADALVQLSPSELAFGVIRESVDEVLLVDDADILTALQFADVTLATHLEPSGAVGLAAAMRYREVLAPRTATILTGGNIGAEELAALLSRTAERTGEIS